jgi:CBS domain-containing protein
MAQTVKDVMTSNVVCCDASATVRDAAKLMRDRDIGDVLVNDGDTFRGIVTDRDIVVRCVAEGGDTKKSRLGDVCSGDITTATPETSVDDAARMMRDRAIRRLPVVQGGKAVGIVSLGDLAMDRDPSSVLGGISAARPSA